MSAVKATTVFAQSEMPKTSDLVELADWLDQNDTGELGDAWERVELRPESSQEIAVRLAAMPPAELLRRMVGERIAEALVQRNMRQAELARLLDKSPAYISRLVRGQENLTLDSLAQLAEVLQCEARDLMPSVPRAVASSRERLKSVAKRNAEAF